MNESVHVYFTARGCTIGRFSEFSHSRDFIWDFVEHELNPCVCSDNVGQGLWLASVSVVEPGQGTGNSGSIAVQIGDTHWFLFP